nr:hypothetical protein [Bacilli bacterium]
MKKTRIITTKNIFQALGALLAFIAIAFLVSPLSKHLWYLAYGVEYLLGVAGYYILLPVLLIYGVYLLFKGSLASKPFSWRIHLCFLALFLGTMVLSSHLAQNNVENYNFAEAMAKFQGENSYRLFLFAEQGGGLAGSSLYNLMKPIAALPIALFIIFYLAAAILVLYRPVSIFVSFLIRRISSTKEERARKKEEDARQKEQKERERRHLEASPIEAPKSNPFFDEPISHPNEAELSSPSEFPSRVERYHEEIPSPIPEDKPHEPSKIAPSTPIIQNVGISEASIDISDEELREMGFDPSTMKVEPAPKEPSPQPTVYKAPETHYENSSSIETPQTPSSVQKIISEPVKEEVRPETPLHEDPLPLFEDRIEEKKAEP